MSKVVSFSVQSHSHRVKGLAEKSCACAVGVAACFVSSPIWEGLINWDPEESTWPEDRIK